MLILKPKSSFTFDPPPLYFENIGDLLRYNIYMYMYRFTVFTVYRST